MRTPAGFSSPGITRIEGLRKAAKQRLEEAKANLAQALMELDAAQRAVDAARS